MSLHQLINHGDRSAVHRSSDRRHPGNVVPRGFLGEVAMVAIAVVALTVNMKIMSWLSKGSVKK